MLIQLNTEEILKAVVDSLPTLDIDEARIGYINGELFVVAAVNDTIPEGLFEDEASDEAETVEQTSGEKKPKKRRTRRTKAQIEADEAAKAKGEAAAPAPVKEPQTETQPAPTAEVSEPAQPEVAEQPEATNPETLFADAGATANPFGENGATVEDVQADDLFGGTGSKAKPVTETSDAGFAKPAVDDDTINLFA